MSDPWIELATRITESERAYNNLAEEEWRDGDVVKGVRFRGRAEGLRMARDHQLEVAAKAREASTPAVPASLEAAMHSVWLHGDWYLLTRGMTTELREVAADAVQAHATRLNQQDPELAANVRDLRWWRE